MGRVIPLQERILVVLDGILVQHSRDRGLLDIVGNDEGGVVLAHARDDHVDDGHNLVFRRNA